MFIFSKFTFIAIIVIFCILQLFTATYKERYINSIKSKNTKNTKNKDTTKKLNKIKENFDNFDNYDDKNDTNNNNNSTDNNTDNSKNNKINKQIKDFSLNFIEPNYAFTLFNNNIYLETMNSVNFTARQSSDKYNCIKKYMESLVSITQKEKINTNLLVNYMISKIKDIGLQNFLILNIRTCKLAKGNMWLEFNMPHTHSNIIILPQRWYTEIESLNISTLLNESSTLIHELVHTNQRENMSPYLDIYDKWGFIKAEYIDNMDHIRLLNRHNPDGLEMMWVWFDKLEKKYYWIGTLFKSERPSDLTDVNYLAFPLTLIGNNIGGKFSFKCQDNATPLRLEQFTNFLNYFKIVNNHYHPNEIIASYMEIYYKKSIGKGQHLTCPGYETFLKNIKNVLNN